MLSSLGLYIREAVLTPRICLDATPRAKLIASIKLDLPLPFGPTTAVRRSNGAIICCPAYDLKFSTTSCVTRTLGRRLEVITSEVVGKMKADSLFWDKLLRDAQSRNDLGHQTVSQTIASVDTSVNIKKKNQINKKWLESTINMGLVYKTLPLHQRHLSMIPRYELPIPPFTPTTASEE